jgi:hypothetical protein
MYRNEKVCSILNYQTMIQFSNLTSDKLKLFPWRQIISRHDSKAGAYTIAPIHDRDGGVVLWVYAAAPLDTGAPRHGGSLMMPVVTIVSVIGTLELQCSPQFIKEQMN